MAKKSKEVLLDLAVNSVEEEQAEEIVQPAPVAIKAEGFRVVYDERGKVISSFPV